MSNPYHDESGRFCSKNGMQAAINRVFAAGDMYTAGRMRDELTQYEIISSTQPDERRVASLTREIGLGAADNKLLTARITQQYSDADLEAAEKKYSALLEESKEGVESLNRTREDFNAEVAEKLPGVESYAQLRELNHSAEAEKLALATEVSTKLKKYLVEAGVPASYASSYVERKAPKLGLASYTDTFRNNYVPAESRHAVTSDHKAFKEATRLAEHKAKILAAVKKMEDDGHFSEYNTKVELSEKMKNVYDSINPKYLEAIRRSTPHIHNVSKAENGLKTIQTAREWRANLKSNGYSKYTRVAEISSLRPGDLKTKNGVVSNVAIATPDGRFVQVSGVEKSGYHPGEGSLVGVNGQKYHGVTRYANYRTEGFESYVVVDPTAGGDKMTHEGVNVFHHTVDSSG